MPRQYLGFPKILDKNRDAEGETLSIRSFFNVVLIIFTFTDAVNLNHPAVP